MKKNNLIVESLYSMYDIDTTPSKKKLNESFVEEWWGQTEEDPSELERYGISVDKIKSRGDETLYQFTGEREAFKKAMRDGYFYSLDYDPESNCSDDLKESLKEAVNPENAEINEIIRRTVGKKNISKADAKALADAGITRDEDGQLRGKSGKTLRKYGRTTVYGPSHTTGRYYSRWNGKLVNRGNQYNDWDFRTASPHGVEDKQQFDKVDLKNYLDTDRPGKRGYTDYYNDLENENALQPYSKDYRLQKNEYANNMYWVNDYNNDIMSDEEIEKKVNDYRQKLHSDQSWAVHRRNEYAADAETNKQKMNDIVAKARAKHPKNESLSLKEDVNRDSTWKKVYDFLENELDNFEGSQITTYDVSMKIPEYNEEWCVETPSYEYAAAKKEYLTVLTDMFFTYRDEAEE